MPIYEYKCKKCNLKFSLLMGVTSDKAELKCPQCEGKEVERVFSTFSVGNSSSSSSSDVDSCPTGTCPTGVCGI
ncbi:MAG: zinc ribbon domain-containing protein [Armatimonadetes bacterium CG07_land_8_20_14_0_80_40_9]|nr:MAG: zinc ribbon domain-containing protein [Armatimonadetes bacterium CG07_land_8_20_14_0_80_40_9]